MESMISTSGASCSTESSTSGRLVSESTSSAPLRADSRWARSFNWLTDSSPETYSTRKPWHRLLEIWSIRVAFPMPGAPPTSTSEPFTAPPPKTRSSSPMPVENRISLLSSISVMCTAFAAFLADGRPAARALGALSCSTMVFHAPQDGHRPAHFGVSFPQAVQKNTVFVFPAMVVTLRFLFRSGQAALARSLVCIPCYYNIGRRP